MTMPEIRKPSKVEQKLSIESYNTLIAAIDQIDSDKIETEIEMQEIKEKIVIPVKALILLCDVLKSMSQGKAVAIMSVATEITTQKAADILGCSRPHLVKLLEEGKVAYAKVGKHRRVKFEDIIEYKRKQKEEQKKHIIDIMHYDEEIGLYDS